MPRNSNRAIKSGVTLAEMMIAASVLLLMCAMMYLLFANCIILNQLNRERTLAMTHAEYVLEEIKNESFTNLESRINGISPWTAEWDWNTATIGTEGLSALNNEAIDTNEVGADPDLLDIVVNVSWTNRRGITQTVSLETLLAAP